MPDRELITFRTRDRVGADLRQHQTRAQSHRIGRASVKPAALITVGQRKPNPNTTTGAGL
jgi:hypothetical protein